MSWLHQSALYLHIVVGIIALVMFWIPVLSKKGSINHKRFGRSFAIIMYTVGWSGVLMASFDLWRPLAIGFLRYSFKAELTHPKEWWVEHLGALLSRKYRRRFTPKPG